MLRVLPILCLLLEVGIAASNSTSSGGKTTFNSTSSAGSPFSNSTSSSQSCKFHLAAEGAVAHKIALLETGQARGGSSKLSQAEFTLTDDVLRDSKGKSGWWALPSSVLTFDLMPNEEPQAHFSIAGDGTLQWMKNDTFWVCWTGEADETNFYLWPQVQAPHCGQVKLRADSGCGKATTVPPPPVKGNSTITPPPPVKGNSTITPPPKGNTTITPPKGNTTVTPPKGNTTITPPKGNITLPGTKSNSTTLTSGATRIGLEQWTARLRRYRKRSNRHRRADLKHEVQS